MLGSLNASLCGDFSEFVFQQEEDTDSFDFLRTKVAGGERFAGETVSHMCFESSLNSGNSAGGCVLDGRL
jgi:hypothetical protein